MSSARIVGDRPSVYMAAFYWVMSVVLSTAFVASAADVEVKKGGKSEAEKISTKPAPAKLVAHCIDGSVLRIELRDPKITIKTPYGSLDITTGDIRRIDFAVRIPDEARRRAETAITKLGSPENEIRELARIELLELEAMAYPALLKAATNEDVEISMSAERLLAEIREHVPEDDLTERELDLITTDDSQIAGKIQLQTLRVETVSLGQQDLKVTVLKRIDSGITPEADAKDAMQDPGTMVRYQGQVGSTFRFRLTGPPPGFHQGGVWGTDIYTFDSHLAMAAVHAGVLKPGQTKVVSVVMLGPQEVFRGSMRNGIASGDWGQYPSAYRFKTTQARPRLGR
jgi:hypothetical protein